MIAWYHQRYIHQRRVDVLAGHFSQMIARDATVLDVGCGDGSLAARIAQSRPDVTIRGIDVLVREGSAIPIEAFDGINIPLPTDAVDTSIMIDVLHHTDTQRELLCEAARVARKQVILKDHYLQGIAAYPTLALMDHVGNARHGVDIPCNYLTPSRWEELFEAAGLREVERRERLGLYPPPLRWLFERRMHFIIELESIR
jgi:SAM-dependent methyltransferase